PGVTDVTATNPPPAPPIQAAPTTAAAAAPDLLLRVPFANRAGPQPAAAVAVAPAPPTSLAPLSYSVVDGDTLTSIAAKFGVSPDDLATTNGLQGNQDQLKIDQKLTVPPVP